MSNTLAFGKKAFTVAVVGATIAWAVGFSALVPLTASAASAGDLIRGSLPAVYYYGSDGKRYVFPNEKTYKTWYSDFSSVKVVSDAELAAIAIGGNVTYRATAGSMLAVKIQTSPTVYAVTNGGELRAIPDEATAVALLGADWNKKVHDVPDAFFTNYKVGAAVAAGASLASLGAASATIAADKSLAATPATPVVTPGAVTLSLASDTAPSASAPVNAGEVIFTKVLFTGTGSVASIKVTRSGLSADADLSSVKLFDGTTQLGTNQTFDANHQATFVLTTPWAVSGSKTLTIAGDIAGGATGGNAVVLGIAAATDVTLVAGTVGGTFPLRGNAMTVSAATILGSLTPTAGATQPAAGGTVDSGNTSSIVLLATQLAAGANEDIEVTRFAAMKAGTHIASDVGGLELYDLTNAKVLGSATGWNADSRVVFDLSAAPLKITKGNSINLELRIPAGKVLAGSGRTLSAKLEKSGNTFTGISARGTTYNLGIVPSGAAFDGTANAITINAGSITVLKSASTPATGNISPGTNNAKLGAWDFTVKGEALRSTTTIFTFAAGTIATANITSCVLRDKNGTAVAGPVNPAEAGAALTVGNTVTFSTTITYPVGTSTYSFHCNIASGNDIAAGETVQASITPSTTNLVLTGVSTGNSVATAAISPAGTAVSANVLTIQAAGLRITNLGTPPASTVVQGAQNVLAATVNVSGSAASSGEDVRVTQLSVTDTTSALADVDDVINIRLTKNDGTTLLADMKQPSDDADGDTTNDAGEDAKFTFTLSTPLVISRTSDEVVRVYVDVKGTLAGTAGATHTYSVAAVTDVVATGVTTGTVLTTAQKGTTTVGAGQALTLQTTGSLTITNDSSAPTSGLIVAGRSGVTVAVYKFVGANENTQLRRIQVTRVSATGADADVAQLHLYEGDTKLGTAVLSNAIATFDITDKNFVVDRLGNPRKLTVKADMNTTIGGATSRDDLRFNLVGMLAAATGAPLGLSSGGGVILDSDTSDADADNLAATGTFIVRKTAPTFTKSTLNTSALIPGTQKVLVLDVTAAPEADVIFDMGAAAAFAAGDGRLRFAISENGGTATVKTVTLKRKDTGATLDTFTYDLTTAGGVLDFNFSTAGLTVAAGTTVTLEVEVGVTDYATAGESFQLTLNTDVDANTADADIDLGANDNVRWSDDSSTTVDLNGYGLEKYGLPVINAVVKG